MTPLQINMAITKSLGTHTVVLGRHTNLDVPMYHVTDRNGRSADLWEGGSSSDLDFEHPVRYCSSLDAMWALEETLDDIERCAFAYILSGTFALVGYDEWSWKYDFHTIHASALHRAKTYCRIKNISV